MITLIALVTFALPFLIAAIRGVDVVAFLMIAWFTMLGAFFALVAFGGARSSFWAFSAVLWFISLLIACISKSRRERADERRHRESIAATGYAKIVEYK